MDNAEVEDLDELSALTQTLNFASPVYLLSKYLCNYCGKICLEALEAKCKHLYCRKCVDKMLGDGKECPLDKTILKEEEIAKATVIQDQILKLPVYCLYQRSGCPVSMPLYCIRKHIQLCESAPVQCPQGCTEPVKTCNLESHLQFTCKFRHVSCDFCDKKFVLAFKSNHLQECPRYPIECPKECGVPHFPQEELSQHLKVCSVKLQLCRHQHLGCEYQGFGSALRLHEGDVGIHFQLMANSCGYLNLNFDILLQETRSNVLLLQNENYALREALKELMKQCKTLSDSKDDVEEKLALLRITTYKLMQHKDLFVDKNEKNEEETNKKDMGKNVSDELFEQLKIVQEIKFKMQDEMLKHMEQQDAKIRTLTATINCSGVYVWKITNYHQRKEESLSRRRPFEFSEPFLTERYGYQVCGKVYLGGEGEARGTHISLYIIIMRGPNDDILSWPFSHKFHLSVLDHKHTHEKQHHGEQFLPNNSSSFQKPSSAMNTGAGLTKFVSIADIEGSDVYLRNDTIYIKMAIVPTGSEHRKNGKHKKSK